MAPLAHAGIGASDAPVIMGETAFKTPRTLWSIKTGRMQEASAGPAARRGRELERFARRAYERRTGIQVEPLCLVHGEFEWMRASLDGLSFDGSTLVEIKCPLSLRDRSSAQQGRIPCSTTHNYSISWRSPEQNGRTTGPFTGPTESWSKCTRPGIREATVGDRGRVLATGEGKPLARTGHDELDLGADRKWRHTAFDYCEARLRLENATVEERKLRAMLSSMATSRWTYGCGVEVLKSSRKGAVDYSAVPELRGVNLELYRKPPVAVVKINTIEPNR